MCPKFCILYIIKPRCEPGGHSTCQPLAQAHPTQVSALAPFCWPPLAWPAPSHCSGSSGKAPLQRDSPWPPCPLWYPPYPRIVIACFTALSHHMQLLAELSFGCLAHKIQAPWKWDLSQLLPRAWYIVCQSVMNRGTLPLLCVMQQLEPDPGKSLLSLRLQLEQEGWQTIDSLSCIQ